MDEQYWKCDRCGAICCCESDNIPTIVCTSPMLWRTSGICGGIFSIKSTKQEFENLGNHNS